MKFRSSAVFLITLLVLSITGVLSRQFSALTIDSHINNLRAAIQPISQVTKTPHPQSNTLFPTPGLQFDWSGLLALIISNAVILSVLGFILQSLFSQLLRKNMERYKQEIDQKQAEFQANIDQMIFRNQIMFTELHKTRVEKISEVYQKLVRVERDLLSLVIFANEDNHSKSLAESSISFYDYFVNNALYFSKPLADKIFNFFTKSLILSTSCQFQNDITQYESVLTEVLSNTSSNVLDNISLIKSDIEDEFRTLIGSV